MQRQVRIDQAVRAYAEAVVGTPEDLDPALEAAGLELLERASGNNPYLAAAGMFADDTFAADVEAFTNAQRDREREEAARAADA